MEWRTEAKTKQEIVEYISNLPEDYLWSITLDANEEGDRIETAMVGFMVFPYSHLAKDLCRRENFFIENRLRFKRVNENGKKLYCRMGY